LAGDDLRAIQHAIDAQPRFAAAYQRYLNDFGERCLNELKLESATLHDNPLPLLHAVAQLANQPPSTADPHAASMEARTQAEQQVQEALGNKPLRRALFGWVMRSARERVVA